MKPKLDMGKIANGLGAERRGKVSAGGGYFGAVQLAADVQARFQTPASGGRPTNPDWTEQRLVRLAPKTLARLEKLAAQVNAEGATVEPLQLAALLLEKTTAELSRAGAKRLVGPRRRAR
jgi:hypothetical protein